MNKQIVVKGKGSVSARPDLIVIAITLQSRHAEYAKTIAKGAAELESIRDAIVKAGLEAEDLKTTNFSVDTEFESIRDQKGNYENIFRGYVCRHGLKIEFDFDMKRLSEVIHQIARCKARPEFTIRFSVRDKDAVCEQLLINATENARVKAEVLTKAAGVRLGELVSIDYNWGEIHLYSQTNYEDSCMSGAPNEGAHIDIEPDNIDVQDTVTFVWEIIK